MTRMRVALTFASIGVVAVAALSAVAAAPNPAPTFAVESDPVLVSIPGHRTTEFTAATDPSNPLHLVAGGIDWDTDSGTWTCAAFVSWDGGLTWNGTALPPGGDYDAHGDPWVAIDHQGTAHYSCLQLQFRSNGGGRILYYRSTDGGNTWSEPIPLAPRAPQHSVDRTGIIAGPSGSVVACFNEYDFEAPLTPALFDGLAVASSNDGGTTWSTSQQVTNAYAACRGSAAGPSGDLYFSFYATTESGATTATIRSTDGGATWSTPGLTPVVAEDTPNGFYYGGAVAVSPRSGSVFVARPGEVPLLFRSTDHGSTYERRLLPAIPSECDACTNVVRTLVAANASGDIGVQVEIGDLDEVSDTGFYPAPLTKEIWLIVSHDDGMTWLDPVRVTTVDPANSWLDPATFAPMPSSVVAQVGGINRDPSEESFWATVGPLQRSDHLINGGDYTGMTTSGDAFVVMWIAHYNGIPQVWSARLSAS